MKIIFRGKKDIEQLVINFNETLEKKAFNGINLAKDEYNKFWRLKERIIHLKSIDDSEKLINEFINAPFDTKEGKAYFFNEPGEIW